MFWYLTVKDIDLIKIDFHLSALQDLKSIFRFPDQRSLFLLGAQSSIYSSFASADSLFHGTFSVPELDCINSVLTAV